MRTTYTVKASEIDKKWYIIDASGHTLGRLTSEISKILMGKHKPIYTPYLDTGDYVIVINSDKIKVTGNKMNNKLYRKHTLYPGGLKETKFREILSKKPNYIIKHAVKGMLPKKALGKKMLKKLYVYNDENHCHEAQRPKFLEIKY